MEEGRWTMADGEGRTIVSKVGTRLGEMKIFGERQNM